MQQSPNTAGLSKSVSPTYSGSPDLPTLLWAAAIQDDAGMRAKQLNNFASTAMWPVNQQSMRQEGWG